MKLDKIEPCGFAAVATNKHHSIEAVWTGCVSEESLLALASDCHNERQTQIAIPPLVDHLGTMPPPPLLVVAMLYFLL